jgi:hypothetical protein
VGNQGIKPGIPGQNSEARLGMLDGEPAEVVGDVEVQGIVAVALHLDVLDIRAEGLEGTDQRHRHLGLVRAKENFDFEGAAPERRNVVGLDVLKIEQKERGLHQRGRLGSGRHGSIKARRTPHGLTQDGRAGKSVDGMR